MPRTKTLYHISPENVNVLRPQYSPKHAAKGLFVSSKPRAMASSWAPWASRKDKAPGTRDKPLYKQPKSSYKTLTLYTLTLPMEDYEEAVERHWARYKECAKEVGGACSLSGAWLWDEETFIPEDLMKNLKIVSRKTQDAEKFFSGNFKSSVSQTVPRDDKHLQPRTILKMDTEKLASNMKFFTKKELEQLIDNLKNVDMKEIVPDPYRASMKNFEDRLSLKTAEKQRLDLSKKRDEMVKMLQVQVGTMRENAVSIKDLIFEQVDLDEGDLEEIANYPEGFSIETLKSLPSFNKKVKYSQEHLYKIGAGSSRVVFVADDNTVIKLAKNAKGLAQNKLEIAVGQYDSEGNITAKIFDYDKDNLWVEMERARKAKTSDFVKEFGIPFDEFQWNVRVVSEKLHGHSSWKGYDLHENLKNNKTFAALQNLMADYQMTSGDITRTSSWGVVMRDGKEKLVLVDFGLNKQVFKDFYAR